MSDIPRLMCGEVGAKDAGQRVKVFGWVARRRDHGEHLVFVDLRDNTGIVQCVIDASYTPRSEQVIEVLGTVKTRPTGMENPDLSTGMIEIGDCEVVVHSQAEPPPFLVEDRIEVDESVRLKYRFVDLRRPKMQANLRTRAKVLSAIRRAMERQGFCEIETPMLWAPTPEGSREFAIPSRLQHGSCYVLPQSPQIAKQLLMVAGFDKYYQIARCMRDEDLRSDRQFEFTQLDMEASFVTQEEILAYVSEAVLDAAQAGTGDRPKTIEEITWAESMDRFGTDKPDLRFATELIDCSKVFEKTQVKAFQAPCVKALVFQGAVTSTSRARLDELVERAKSLGAKGLAWFKVGEETLESPLTKFLGQDEIADLRATTKAEPGDVLLLVADQYRLACEVLGQIRLDLGQPLITSGEFRYVWVLDFPLFDGVDANTHLIAAHHPFTMPHEDDLELLSTNPGAVRSRAYDLVVNGWELGSGSVRIHRPEIQSKIFELLGLSKTEATERFGFLLRAFGHGAPPHAGFAFGIDRLVALLCGEESIREVIAFPKTQSGADPMTGAPKPLSPDMQSSLGIRFSTQ